MIIAFLIMAILSWNQSKEIEASRQAIEASKRKMSEWYQIESDKAFAELRRA